MKLAQILALLPLTVLALGASADPPKPVKAPAPTKEILDKGKGVFTANCVPCHGEKGEGDGPVGLALNPRPRNFAKDPFKQGTSAEEIFRTISEGVPGTLMVAWPQLSEDDRWAAAHFVRTMVPKAATPTKPKK